MSSVFHEISLASAHLNPLMCLVHELKELVHHRLEEPPVRPQEPRVLPHDVHYVGRDDCLGEIKHSSRNVKKI